MATSFDYQRALEESNQPLNTLAHGILSNSQQQSARMFQLGEAQQRRRQQLEDQRRSETQHDKDIERAQRRQDDLRKEDREQFLRDREDTRDYESSKLDATQRFQFGMEMLREDATAKRSDASTKKYFDGLDKSQQNAIIKKINEEQGLAPDKDEDPGAFITRAAKARTEGFKARANAYVSRQDQIDNLTKQGTDLTTKAESDLAKNVKSRAVESLKAILKPEEAALLNNMDAETVLNKIAATQPGRAQSLRTEFVSAQEQAQKVLEPTFLKELRMKQEPISKKLQNLARQNEIDLRSRDWDNVAPHVQEKLGLPVETIPSPGGAFQRVAPTKEGTDSLMKDVLGTGSTDPQPAPQAENGRQVEGLFPAAGRIGRQAIQSMPRSSLASEGASQIGGTIADAASGAAAGLRAIPTGLFGGTMPNQTSTGGFPLLDIPTGIVKMGLAPVDALGNAMSDVSESLTGNTSYPASTPDQEAAYRADRGLTMRRGIPQGMGDRQVRDQRSMGDPESIKQRWVQTIYDGVAPTPEEETSMREAAMHDGLSKPMLQDLMARVTQGDQSAIGILKGYVGLVRGGRAFSAF